MLSHGGGGEEMNSLINETIFRIFDKAFAQGQKNRAAMARIIADLKRINASRHALFEEKNKQKAEKDKLYQEVKRLNQQTSELKQHIRHCCGSKGQIWFQNLERRKKLRSA